MIKKICYSLMMVVSLFAASANGAPMAYSVNSDSDSKDFNSLYLIDLSSGSDQLQGNTGLDNGQGPHIATEGLALAPDETLWGIDDSSRTLFQINKVTAAVSYLEEVLFQNLPEGRNDFGMTFACDNSIYVTSVIDKTLYRLEFDIDAAYPKTGNAVPVGFKGALNANISAIAAIGNPTRLYGLGNGDEVSPSLYSIDVNTGVATAIGPLGDVDQYSEGGMGFDSDGTLWAITDRRAYNGKSQILSIDPISGAATVVASTINEIGFESLAVAPPADCDAASSDTPDYPRIPTLNTTGRLLATLVLLIAGAAFLRRRIS